MTGPDAIGEAVRELVREEVRQAVREVIRDLPGAEPAFASKARAARLLGVSTATLRRWQRANVISRGVGGRVDVAQVRRFMASGKASKPVVSDLAAARAQRAAAGILKGRP